MPTAPLPLASGLLLNDSILHSPFFAMLAAFVAINTVMYGALTLAKILPKVYAADWIHPRNQRAESRSIFPEEPPRTLKVVPSTSTDT